MSFLSSATSFMEAFGDCAVEYNREDPQLTWFATERETRLNILGGGRKDLFGQCRNKLEASKFQAVTFRCLFSDTLRKAGRQRFDEALALSEMFKVPTNVPQDLLLIQEFVQPVKRPQDQRLRASSIDSSAASTADTTDSEEEEAAETLLEKDSDVVKAA